MADLFFIGSQLPTTFDCVCTVFRLSSRQGSDKQRQIINSVSGALLEHWQTVFPKESLITKWGVASKLTTAVKAMAKLKKNKKNFDAKLKVYREKYTILLDVLAPVLRENLNSLSEELQVFYQDQTNARLLRFEDIDYGFLYNDLENLGKSDDGNANEKESGYDEYKEANQELISDQGTSSSDFSTLRSVSLKFCVFYI